MSEDGDGLRWLEVLRDFEGDRTGDIPSLDSLRKLLDCIGDPQNHYRAIHIAGTNGKGAVAHFASVLGMRSGFSVGTYTSPDLGDLCERIRLNLEPITQGQLDAELSSLRMIGEAFEIAGLTKFEVLTAAALSLFSLEGIELGVVEVGMGGAWDATNVVDAEVAVITSVGLDHQEYLGSTVEAIAEVKSGIIKEGSTVIVGPVSQSVETVLLTAAQRSEVAEIHWVGYDLVVQSQSMAVGGWVCEFQTPYGTYSDIFVSGHGRHHVQNALIAIGSVEALERGPLPREVVEDAMRYQTLRGRLQVASREPLVVVDVAHNPDAARAVSSTLAEEFSHVDGWVVLFGLARGRESEPFLRALNPSTIDELFVIEAPGSRADLVEVAHEASLLGIRSHLASSVDDTMNQVLATVRKDQGVLVIGGHGLAGQALEFLRRTLP